MTTKQPPWTSRDESNLSYRGNTKLGHEKAAVSDIWLAQLTPGYDLLRLMLLKK